MSAPRSDYSMGAQEDLLHDISNAAAVNNKKYSRYLKSKNLRNTEGRTDYSDAKFVTAIVFHPRSQASGKLVVQYHASWSLIPQFSFVPSTCTSVGDEGPEYPRKFTSERILT